MSYEWLNGVDSSINFGSQNNQNPYFQNVNQNEPPMYTPYENQNNQGMHQMPPVNNNYRRPLPSVPNTSTPPINSNPYNMQPFQQSYNNVRRPLPDIPQHQNSANPGGRPLPMVPDYQQQFSNEPTLNPQFSGNNYQSPNFLGNGSNNSSNPYLSNTFAQNQNNQFMGVDPPRQEYQNTGLQDFDKIYGNGEMSSHSSTNVQQTPNNFNSPSPYQPIPTEKFTPNYDRIDYKNAVSIFGKTKEETASPPVNPISQQRLQRSTTNPFRNMQNSNSNPTMSTFNSNTQAMVPPPVRDDFASLVHRIPISLGHHNLSEEEKKNYTRWFNNIIAKKKQNSEQIRMVDIFEFLHNNFRVEDDVKKKLMLIFKDIKEHIGLDNFFAVLRCLVLLINEQGELPTKERLYEKALPMLKPRSILAKNDDKEEVYEEVTDEQGPGQLDFDNFASLLMTGNSRRVKRVVMRNGNRVQNKSVRFSDNLVMYEGEAQPYEEDDDIENWNPKVDFSLPMDQLMQKMNTPQGSKEDEAELADMKDSLTHFQNLPKVDTVSMSMNGGLPYMNANQQQSANNGLQPLRPTATGSANYMINRDSTNQTPQYLQPTATGSANYMMNQQNLNQQPQQLQPTATGSANHLFSSGRAPNNMYNTTFGGNNMNSGLNDLKSIQDQIDFISAQMTGGNNNAFK